MEGLHIVVSKGRRTAWTIMFCAQPHCDWWDGFKRPDDAKRAAQFHELTGGDVRGELRAHLGEAYPAAQRPSRCP